MRSLKNPVRLRKLDRFNKLEGWCQSTTAVILVLLAWTPSMLTLEPEKIILDLKNSDFFANRDRPDAHTCSKNLCLIHHLIKVVSYHPAQEASKIWDLDGMPSYNTHPNKEGPVVSAWDLDQFYKFHQFLNFALGWIQWSKLIVIEIFGCYWPI